MNDHSETESTKILDVRPLLERGEPPFSLISETVDELKPGQDFLLITPFEPYPLYLELGKRGYKYSASFRDDGDWDIRFTPAS